MLRTVHLGGELGEKFGAERQIEANSFEDVIRCLNANFDNFKSYLKDCYEKDIVFIWKVNDEVITDPEQLKLQYPVGDMIITPVPSGAIGGIFKKAFKLVLGAALIFVGLAVPGVMGFAIFMVGQYLFSQGLYELLAEDPVTDADKDTSYIFSGSEQNINEDAPIPICYGRLRIPGRPISFEVRNEDGFISSALGNDENRTSNPDGNWRRWMQYYYG